MKTDHRAWWPAESKAAGKSNMECSPTPSGNILRRTIQWRHPLPNHDKSMSQNQILESPESSTEENDLVGIVSHDLLAVTVGQEYKNPHDGPGGGPTIRIVHVEGDDAVCVWRYADSTKNALKAFVKSRASILEDWILIPSANANVDLPDIAAPDSASKSNNPAVSG